jgi:hypothetical protein
MTTTPKLWKSLMLVNTTQTGDQFHGQIAGVNAPILNGRRATLLPTVAFRLWAAASICLATDGATAAESVTVLPPICAAADLRLITLIEAQGEDQDVAAESLAQAFFTVMEARKACNQGQVEAAIKLYEGIPLPGDGGENVKPGTLRALAVSYFASQVVPRIPSRSASTRLFDALCAGMNGMSINFRSTDRFRERRQQPTPAAPGGSRSRAKPTSLSP